MSVPLAAHLLRSRALIPTRHGCLSVIVLITRPEESLCLNEETLNHRWLSHQIKYNFGLITRPEESLCVNEKVLTHRGLPLQINYNVVQSIRSPAEIAGSNSTEAWRSVSYGADHSSSGVVVCE